MTANPVGGAERGGSGGGSKAQDEVAVLDVENFGAITLRFFPDLAPKHVESFKKLAREGFYDGTCFHRVIPGFMIQGGDPLSKKDPTNAGTGGPGYKLKAEFNERPHVRGTLSAARSGHPDSAGSQFFICHDAAPHLDRQYTVFGEVLSGIEVVDKICKAPLGGPQRSTPVTPVRIAKASIEAR